MVEKGFPDSVTAGGQDESLNQVGKIPDNALFAVTTLPGKGRCLTAVTDIGPGTLVLCEKPLLTAPRSLTPGALETMVQLSLKALTKNQQRQFLSLQNNFAGTYPLGGVIPTNAYPCGVDGETCAVYPTICLLNHSCRPNCQHAWNSEEGVETVYAIRQVKKGEELCVSYDVTGPSMDRKAVLERDFGFRCNCEACSLPDEEQVASDTRHLAIQRLDQRISRLHTRPPLGVLWDCHLLLRILDTEYSGYPGTLAARVYWDAFQVTIAHGDLARAKVFAEKSYREAAICEGRNTPEVKTVKGLMEDPASDDGFEQAGRGWSTDIDMIPKELDEEDFEKWLFKRE